jgi:superfamily II DNA helicase RecQ
MEHDLKEIFKYEGFKSVYQKKAIEAILKCDHKNYLINMRTQGGKSLCYQYPGKSEDLKFTAIFI